jgi:hypothetical protein
MKVPMKLWVRYAWQTVYLPAVIETNPTVAEVKISQARYALERRRLYPLDADEEKALAAAEATLRTIPSEAL